MKSAKQACNRDRSPSRWKLSPLKHVFSNKAYFYFEFERCLFPICITFPIRSFTPAQRTPQLFTKAITKRLLVQHHISLCDQFYLATAGNPSPSDERLPGVSRSA